MEQKTAERIVDGYALTILLLGLLLYALLILVNLTSQVFDKASEYSSGSQSRVFSNSALFTFSLLLLAVIVFSWALWKKNSARVLFVGISGIFVCFVSYVSVYSFMKGLSQGYPLIIEVFILLIYLFLISSIYFFEFNKDIKALFVKKSVESVESSPAKKVVIAPALKE